jgi:hypothetical protein
VVKEGARIRVQTTTCQSVFIPLCSVSHYFLINFSCLLPFCQTLGYETARSTPTWVDGQQKIIEQARLWYDDMGPLAKAKNKEPTKSTKGHWYCVQLIALNFELSETSMSTSISSHWFMPNKPAVVDRNSTFSQIGFQLHTSNAATLPVALEQISGPFPRWRIPDIDSRVPRGLQKIYIADINEPFTLALVRDVEEDFPLLLRELSPCFSLKHKNLVYSALASFSTSTVTMGDLIGASLDGRAKARASVRLLSSSRNIQKLTCDIIQEEIKGAYSTTVFVLLTDGQ